MAGRKIKAEILTFTKGDLDPKVVENIELAGRTCYKSMDKISLGSAEKFVKGIMARGHESVIEHSWFVFVLPKKSYNRSYLPEYLLTVMMANNLLSLTEEKDKYILSGNARMFRDLFRNLPCWDSEDKSMHEQLLKAAPVLFSDIIPPNDGFVESHITICPKNVNYTRAEKLKHWFACARITGGSRAFTHQLVRHRRMAISQESQRYCDEAGIYENDYYVIPPSIEEAGFGDYYIEKIKLIDSWYRELQKIIKEAGTGKANEDARFLLPNACCSEIVISCNLQEWRQIFKMRTDSHAQWEIRNGMLQILRQFQKLFPGCFDDFKIVNKTSAVVLT